MFRPTSWRRSKTAVTLLGFLLLATPSAVTADEGWSPAATPLMTKWGKKVNPAKVLPEYPRPQMQRQRWTNLNGLWDYAIAPRASARPETMQGQILVPFAVESALSGVGKTVGSDQRLWYRRNFKVPQDWRAERTLMNFGAVDWDTTVWINGVEVGQHQGGFDPFSVDITSALKPGQDQEVVVAVWDPSDDQTQPRGKQVRKPNGIWYTPVTGIWQTVWIEPVGKGYLSALHLIPDVKTGRLTVDATVDGGPGYTVSATAKGFQQAEAKDSKITLQAVGKPELWGPGNPHLYPLEVTLKDAQGKVVDKVSSYFGMREISLQRDAEGHQRMALNGKPLFQFGPLDQGWWPDGLYTAPSEEALRYDLDMAKSLGFNMVRKHIKVEPARWYYLCDQMGLLVWQDMPSGGPEFPWRPNGEHDGTEGKRSAEEARIYDKEWKAIITSLWSHPSIVVWVPFNEGWGQFDTVRVATWTKQLDPERLVNAASGGNDFPVGDLKDAHRYPGPEAPEPDPTRSSVLGEFGGLGLPIAGHLWQNKDNWGYRTLTSRDDLEESYMELLNDLRPLIKNGLSAAIYTQITDVEGEVNGFMTYDREVLKIPAAKAKRAAMKLYR